VKFVNVQTGDVHEAASADDPRFVQSDEWAPSNADGTVNVTYSDGSARSIPVADYKEFAKTYGAFAQSSPRQQEARKQEAYGDAPIRTFAEQIVPFNSYVLPALGVDP